MENRDLYVHREVLCAHSPVFKVMLEADFRERRMDRIPLPGKSVQQVLEMLNFIYPFGHEITGEFCSKGPPTFKIPFFKQHLVGTPTPFLLNNLLPKEQPIG